MEHIEVVQDNYIKAVDKTTIAFEKFELDGIRDLYLKYFPDVTSFEMSMFYDSLSDLYL